MYTCKGLHVILYGEVRTVRRNEGPHDFHQHRPGTGRRATSSRRKPHPSRRHRRSEMGAGRDGTVRPRTSRAVDRRADMDVLGALPRLLRHRWVGACAGRTPGAAGSNARRRPADDRRRTRCRRDRADLRRRTADRHLRHVRCPRSGAHQTHRRLDPELAGFGTRDRDRPRHLRPRTNSRCIRPAPGRHRDSAPRRTHFG